VIAGTEGTFASGADLDEMQARPVDEQRAYLAPPRMYEAIEAPERPVVAAVNGHALGAGLALALACDVRVAGPGAKLGSPEVRLGILPGGGATQRLPRLIGLGDAMRLVLTGDAIDAEEADELGMVQAVADDAEARAVELAGRMARWSPVALSRAKRALRAAWRTHLPEGLGREVDAFAEAFGSRDASEGIQAFLDDREPAFEGR
jgi:enoyl-CoA hydratase